MDNWLVSLIVMGILFGCLLAILTFATLQLLKSWKLYRSDKKFHATRLFQRTRSNGARPFYFCRDRSHSIYDPDQRLQMQNMVKLPTPERTDH